MSAINTAILGIDIAKKKFDVALFRDGKFKAKVFNNSQDGFESLATWLKHHGVEKVHACMEATGVLYEGLALFLYEAGHVVSVTNPFQIKSFGESVLSRTKTDKADARLIARFCEAVHPTIWQPDPPEIRKLQALGRRRDALVSMRTQEFNREPSADAIIKESVQSVIDMLNQQIEQITELIKEHINNNPGLKKKSTLLRTIPGVGDVTIEAILSEVNGFENFKSIEQVVAYMGLSPKEKTSGSSVRGKSRICKTGNIRLRRMLYMPALVAIQHNPAVRALYERLKAKSKNGLIIACACMKKLVHIMFGVLKNNKPFDPAYNMKTA
jgi:transposase